MKYFLITILIFWFFSFGVEPQLNQEIISRMDLPAAEKTNSITIPKGQSRQIFSTDAENPIYYSLTNKGIKAVKPQIVVNDKDWFTDQAIVSQALKELDRQTATREEQALALTNFVVKNRIHWAPPLFDTYYFVKNPVQLFNSWGYGYCADSALALTQLAYLAGLPARLVNLTEHVVSEVFYDGSWHALDPDMEVYYRNFSGAIASVQDIVADNRRLDSPVWLKPKQAYEIKIIREVMDLAYSQPALRNNPVEETINNRDYRKELIYSLRPKETIRFYYDFPKDYYWGFFDQPPPEFTNGILLSGNRGGAYKFHLPFPILAVYIYRPGLCRAIAPVRFSLNGRQWQPINDCQNDVLSLNGLFPKGESSFPTQHYWLALPISLTGYQIATQFQTAPKSLPSFIPGDNDLLLKSPLPAPVQLELGFTPVY